METSRAVEGEVDGHTSGRITPGDCQSMQPVAWGQLLQVFMIVCPVSCLTIVVINTNFCIGCPLLSRDYVDPRGHRSSVHAAVYKQDHKLCWRSSPWPVDRATEQGLRASICHQYRMWACKNNSIERQLWGGSIEIKNLGTYTDPNQGVGPEHHNACVDNWLQTTFIMETARAWKQQTEAIDVWWNHHHHHHLSCW